MNNFVIHNYILHFCQNNYHPMYTHQEQYIEMYHRKNMSIHFIITKYIWHWDWSQLLININNKISYTVQSSIVKNPLIGRLNL